MRAQAALLVALLAAGASATSYWQPPTTSTTTVRPEEACWMPCRCQRLSRWTSRMRAHCVVFFTTDHPSYGPFRIDSVVDEVDFSRSRIHKLYATHLKGLERIKVLQMKSVGLTAITTNAFDRLEDLWSVNLEGNALPSLSPLVLARQERLHYLSLRRNPLTVWPGVPLVGAASLRVLDVSECGIEAVYDSTFRPLGNLRTLHLEGNQLTQLPAAAVAPLPQLARLFLQNNNLLFFPSAAVKNLPQLLELRVDNNTMMEGPLGPLVAPKLQRLSASFCALDSVEPDLLVAVPELRYLELQSNRLSTLWLADLFVNKDLVLLDLTGNPLECDCALRETWLWAFEHVHESNVYCGQPPRSWHEPNLMRLDCPLNTKPTARSTAASGSADGGSASASSVGGEAGATALWVSLSLVAVLAAVGGALLVVYRREMVARYFSPQARAAASGGVDALPLERNNAEEVSVGLPSQEAGVPPWLNQ